MPFLTYLLTEEEEQSQKNKLNSIFLKYYNLLLANQCLYLPIMF